MGFSLKGIFDLFTEVHESKQPEPDGRVIITIDEMAEIVKAACRAKELPEYIDLTKWLGIDETP